GRHCRNFSIEFAAMGGLPPDSTHHSGAQMIGKKVIAHVTTRLKVLLLNGSHYYARTRWSTDPGALSEPSSTPRTPVNYAAGEVIFVESATQQSPIELYVPYLWWYLGARTNRNIYCAVEFTQEPPDQNKWMILSEYTFVINHDPEADAGP